MARFLSRVVEIMVRNLETLKTRLVKPDSTLLPENQGYKLPRNPFINPSVMKLRRLSRPCRRQGFAPYPDFFPTVLIGSPHRLGGKPLHRSKNNYVVLRYLLIFLMIIFATPKMISAYSRIVIINEINVIGSVPAS